jgi:hypothetical protein
MDQPGIERLREHFRRHNRWVLGLTLLTAGVAIALWTVLYGLAWWVFILGGTAFSLSNFNPSGGMFFRGFAATSVVLCIAAWLGRRLRPNQAPRDHKGLGEHLVDLVLAVPRVTLSIFGTGGAAARLTDAELETAWLLLSRMDRSASPLPMQSVPVEIPDPVIRDHVLMALQFSGLIEIRPTSDGPVLAFQNAEARKLAQEKVRLNF